jgi:hypothetical protein
MERDRSRSHRWAKSFVGEPPELRSPFALLDEIEEAKELLILSYTTSLDFFERFALSHARALGAVVSVVSDATMVRADPFLVRRAGAAYLDARAVCMGGAFHPKLLVLVGEEEARVGIGSGNLTMAGWHGNAELLTVLRAGPKGGPATIAEVSGFLHRLADSSVVFGPGAAEALERVAVRLDGFTLEGPGPRLLDNLETPILDALPEGHVDELVCVSPFYDVGLKALQRLVDRFTPSQLSVLVEGRTSVDGARLADLLAVSGGELRGILDEDRFHHGKLIEWVDEEGRWCLTGSPNISRPALLSSVADGGNCELALLSQVDRSPAPASDPRPRSSALELRFGGGAEEAVPAGFLLLAAIRQRDIVRLFLHGRLVRRGRIEAYSTGTDTWRTVAVLEAGHDRYEIDATAVPVGSAVRVLAEDGEVSNEVFVTDLARATRPQMEPVGRVRESPAEVAVQGLGGRLLADVEELRGHLLRVGMLVPVVGDEGEIEDGEGEEGPGPPMARPAPGQDLEDYLAACDPVLGREMTEFALVLPAAPGLDTDYDIGASGFDEDLEDDEAAERDAAEDRSTSDDLGEALRRLPDHDRERWRRWVEKLIVRGPRLPLVVRTLALRSIIHGIGEEIWAETDAEVVLAEAVRALSAEGDEPTEAELAAAGSLAAVAVTWMRAGLDRISVRDERTLLYEGVVHAVAPFLEFRDRKQIAALAEAMPAPALGFGWVEACDQVAEEIERPPVGAELAVRLLEEEYGLEAELGEMSSIELLEPVPPRAEPTLCLALGLSREEGPVVVVGSIVGGARAVAVWQAPHLVIEKRLGNRSWGDLYALPASLSPFSYRGMDAELPRPKDSWQGGEPPPRSAEDLLALAGRT